MMYGEEKKNERKVLFLDFNGIKGLSLDKGNDPLDILKEIIYKADWLHNDVDIVFCSPLCGVSDVAELQEILRISIHGSKNSEFLLNPGNEKSVAELVSAYLSEHPDLKKYLLLSSENLLETFFGHFVEIRDGVLSKKLVPIVARNFRERFWWERNWHFTHDYIEDGIENVVFLDIDGVLNKENADTDKGEYIIEEYVRNLAALVDEFDAEIVLTSSWRDGLSYWIQGGLSKKDYNAERYGMLVSLFAKYHLNIASRTPSLSSGGLARPFEIRTWLAERTDVKRFVILDDDDFWVWNWLNPAFVCTKEGIGEKNPGHGYSKYSRGFTQDKLEKARKVMSAQN